MHKLEKLFFASFGLSLVIGQFMLYAWIHYWDIFFIWWVKGVVVFFLLFTTLLMAYTVYRDWDERNWLLYSKLVLVLAGAFMFPYVLMDTYLPPFALLFYGMALAAVLTYSGFVSTSADNRLGIIELALGSAFPLIAPVLFYILYQLLRMPHLVEIAGLCHVSSFDRLYEGPWAAAKKRLSADISRAVRTRLRREGSL